MIDKVNNALQKDGVWIATIGVLIGAITYLHYSTSTTRWQYHLLYLQSYFIPILIGAFRFGLKGGLGASLAITAAYLPHVMLQWGGFVEENLMRFLQLGLFNVIGYVTGFLSEQRMEENRRYREAAERLQQSLEMLKKQSEQLSELEQQLRVADRLAVVGELTASLAHEVRNPLGAIRGAVEILQDELPPSERKSEFFEILIQETDRLSTVLENYLSLARKQKHQLSQLEAGELLQSVARMLASSARKVGVHIQVETGNAPIRFFADPNQLRQVLINLILNAIQAMPGGGTVTLSARKTAVPDKKNGEFAVELRVRDEGEGIPEEVRSQIFRPFFTTKSDGTGLGLAIVRRIAKENGWELELESEVGKGTTVTVWIFSGQPAGSRAAEQPAERKP